METYIDVFCGSGEDRGDNTRGKDLALNGSTLFSYKCMVVSK
jgi:hypothetical protein